MDAGTAILAIYFIFSIILLIKLLNKRLDKLLFIVFNSILALATAACVEVPFAWYFLGFAIFYLIGLFFFGMEYLLDYFSKLKPKR